MRHLATSLCHQVLLTSLGSLLLLMGTSCDQQVPPQQLRHGRPTPSFRSLSYRITRLDQPSFLDSLHVLLSSLGSSVVDKAYIVSYYCEL